MSKHRAPYLMWAMPLVLLATTALSPAEPPSKDQAGFEDRFEVTARPPSFRWC